MFLEIFIDKSDFVGGLPHLVVQILSVFYKSKLEGGKIGPSSVKT